MKAARILLAIALSQQGLDRRGVIRGEGREGKRCVAPTDHPPDDREANTRMPRGNFGPAMPGKKCTAHNAKEYKEISDLDLDVQMFTEMLVRIGNLKTMQ
jgi:acetylornithine deacetylase/succinyl-diaminopimelate desuccinylase-like protein